MDSELISGDAVNEAYDAIGELVTVQRKRFIPDVYDFIFALAAFVLGYLYSRWVMTTWRGWGVAGFTAAYLLAVSAYLIKRGFSMKNTAALFWGAAVWLTGLSFALWDGIGLSPVRELFLFCEAVYFIIAASGRTIEGKTGNYLLLDGFNAVFIVPFRNFINQYVSFSVLRRAECGSAKKRLPVFLGILFAFCMMLWLIPMLLRADSGGFTSIVNAVTGLIRIDSGELAEFLFYAVFSVPVAAYLYGLVSGAAHKKGTDTITPEGAGRVAAALRILQPVTVYITLGAVCVLYVFFIFCQIPYFFSAFAGNTPEGWLTYSEYARQGFFELCGIAAINLAVITAGNVTGVKRRTEAWPLKAFNIALALITLLLIATAFSKMALYIGAYGLSMPRLLPCVFMLFLSAVFAAVIILQKYSFSIVRFALVTGSVMLCALLLANPDAIVVRYNTNRYLAGTLSDYDAEILYRAGAAGVLPACEVYERTENEQLKLVLTQYLEFENARLSGYKAGGHDISYERYKAGERLNLTFP